MLQWILVDSYVNSIYVHYGSTSEFITLEKFDVLFPDNICPGINSDT